MTDSASISDQRRALDALDAQIHDALMARGAHVALLGKSKARDGQRAYHPAREARVLRARAAAHTGAVPLSAVIAIWREIVSAMLRLQEDAPAFLCADASAVEARSFCGATGRITRLADAQSVFDALKAHPEALGLMPADGAWWAQDFPPGVHIVARAPFLAAPDAESLYILASMPPEESGDDTTLIACPDEACACGRVLARAGKLCLVACNGFVPREDSLPSDCRYLGAFANPWRGA